MMVERGERPIRFVILTVGRSGSNMLCSMLNAHPEILCHHELFNPRNMWPAQGYSAGELDLGTVADRDGHPGAFLAQVWRQHLGHRAVGFKLLKQQSWPAHRLVMFDRGVKKIVLRRRNRLATFVSRITAMQTRRYTSLREPAGNGASPKVTVNLAQFRRSIAVDRAYFSSVCGLLSAMGQRFLEVHYEDLNDDEARRRLLAFIGVVADASLLAPKNKKLRSGRLLDRIANADEVAARLRGTRYERELGA